MLFLRKPAEMQAKYSARIEKPTKSATAWLLCGFIRYRALVRRCFHGGTIMAACVQWDAVSIGLLPREAGAMAVISAMAEEG